MKAVIYVSAGLLFLEANERARILNLLADIGLGTVECWDEIMLNGLGFEWDPHQLEDDDDDDEEQFMDDDSEN
jgi:hypothetical protein